MPFDFFYLPGLHVINPFFLSSELNQGYNHDDDEQEICHCRRVSELKLLEALLIDAVYQHIGGTPRSSLGHDIDQIKHMEGIDNT